jgi:hypothetical protein
MTTMFHTHPGSSRKLFAAIKDGFCRACRPAHLEAAVAATLDQPPAIEPMLSGAQSVSNSGELPTLRPQNVEANMRANREVQERLNASRTAKPLTREQRIQLRTARVDAIRASRKIIMRWQRINTETGEIERGSLDLGTNTPEARKSASIAQAEATSAGCKVTFDLVKA